MGLFDKFKKKKDDQPGAQPAASNAQPAANPQPATAPAEPKKEESFDFGGQDLEIPKFPEPNVPEDKPIEQPKKKPSTLPKPIAQIKKAVAKTVIKKEVKKMPELPKLKQEEPKFPEPAFTQQEFSAPMENRGADKPLFVKIEKYEEAMSTVKSVKEKLKDAQLVLSKLERLKLEEDKEIQTWNRDIEAIKDKMINIDQVLFEVGH